MSGTAIVRTDIRNVPTVNWRVSDAANDSEIKTVAARVLGLLKRSTIWTNEIFTAYCVINIIGVKKPPGICFPPLLGKL
jgi:hypothetical protein